MRRWLGTRKAQSAVTLPDGDVHEGTRTVIARPMAAGQGVLMEAEGEVSGMGPWEALRNAGGPPDAS